MKKKILGLFVTLLFFAFILYKIDFAQVIGSIRLFSPAAIIYITILYIFSILLRGLRWKLFLGNLPKYSWLRLSEIFTIGTMLNIFLPARAGDVYRAYYLGNIQNEKKLKIFGSVILERLFDGSAIFFILLFATINYFSNSKLINTTATIAGSIFLGSLCVAYLIFRTGKIDNLINSVETKINKFSPKFHAKTLPFLEKVRTYTNSFLEGFELLNNPLASVSAFAYSVLIWGLECGVTYLIINSFGINFPVSASLFVLSLITLSTMIPSTSIFLGPFQAAYILALGIYGADKEFSLAVSVVHNVILTLIITAIGLACLLKSNIKSEKNTPNS